MQKGYPLEGSLLSRRVGSPSAGITRIRFSGSMWVIGASKAPPSMRETKHTLSAWFPKLPATIQLSM